MFFKGILQLVLAYQLPTENEIKYLEEILLQFIMLCGKNDKNNPYKKHTI